MKWPAQLVGVLASASCLANAEPLICQKTNSNSPAPRLMRMKTEATGRYEVWFDGRKVASNLVCRESRLDPRIRSCEAPDGTERIETQIVIRSRLQTREAGDVVHTMFTRIEITGFGPRFAPGPPVEFNVAECAIEGAERQGAEPNAGGTTRDCGETWDETCTDDASAGLNATNAKR